jgi:DNA-binding NarL/FixJ family response regulator
LSISSVVKCEFQAVALAEIAANREVDIVLLGGHPGKSIIDALATVKAIRPGLDVIVTGCNLNDAAILNAVSAGAKGCVEEAASVGELVQAIRTVLTGSFGLHAEFSRCSWIRHTDPRSNCVFGNGRALTSCEKEVLGMLVAGCSNKEIAGPLRTRSAR